MTFGDWHSSYSCQPFTWYKHTGSQWFVCSAKSLYLLLYSAADVFDHNIRLHSVSNFMLNCLPKCLTSWLLFTNKFHKNEKQSCSGLIFLFAFSFNLHNSNESLILKENVFSFFKRHWFNALCHYFSYGQADKYRSCSFHILLSFILTKVSVEWKGTSLFFIWVLEINNGLYIKISVSTLPEGLLAHARKGIQ